MNMIPPAALPPTPALAFLGDAVHSAYVREMLVRRGIPKAGELNRLSLQYVTAGNQAAAFRRIEHLLTEEERDLYHRAANSGHLSRPKHASGADYRTATGFEAVLGMHRYLGNEDRIRFLLGEAFPETIVSQDGNIQ